MARLTRQTTEVPDDLLIARNPEEGTSLPYLVRLPLGRSGVVVKARDTWPRTSKIYCHPAPEWPVDAEIVERVPVRSCVRRGASIDLVLDRARENRSQFVFTRVRGGREAIFWQSARTARMARPGVVVPTARASGIAAMQIVVDAHERYAWGFKGQQATTVRQALAVGDYAVRAPDDSGAFAAVVERKSLHDLVSTLTSGRLRFVLAELAGLHRAAVVVEDRYAAVFKFEPARPAVIADGLAECQARYPSVPIVFADSRALAQEWTYRFFGAVLAELEQEVPSVSRLLRLPGGVVLPPAPLAAGRPSTAQVRRWARTVGLLVPDRGRLRPEVWEAWRREHGDAPGVESQ